EEMASDPDWGKDILEPMEILGLDRLDDSQVVLKVRFKTRPMRQWAVRREFLRRVKKRFDQLKIEIPFPHLTLYMGEPKEGNASPMSIRLLREENGN
ncbi:MAG: mechanosensitive ion channel family protein, partial [Desulfatiglandales bacterium]